MRAISLCGQKNSIFLGLNINFNLEHKKFNRDNVLGITVCPSYDNKAYVTDKDLLQLSHLDHSLFTIIRFHVIAFGL